MHYAHWCLCHTMLHDVYERLSDLNHILLLCAFNTPYTIYIIRTIVILLLYFLPTPVVG